MTSNRPPARGISGTLAAPALIGIGYGLARVAAQGGWQGAEWLNLGWLNLGWPGPLTFAVLSGAAIALACRPVLARVAWSRGAAFGLGLGLLVLVGPAADLALGALTTGIGRGATILPGALVGELSGALAGAALMAGLFRPRGGTIDAAAIRARLLRHSPMGWLGRLAGLAAGTVGLWVLLGWGDAVTASAGGMGRAPLVRPNFFLEVSGILAAAPGAAANGITPGVHSAGWGGAWALLFFYWVRALALFLPLAVVCLTIRGTWWQLTLVMAVLVFVVGEFAPLMLDQPYTSTSWLLRRIALGLVRAGVLAGGAAAVLGLPPLRDGGPQL